MSLISVGVKSSASITGNVATLTNTTVPSNEARDDVLSQRMALFKLSDNVDFTFKYLNQSMLGDILGSDPYIIVNGQFIIFAPVGAVFPPTIQAITDITDTSVAVPISFSSQQVSGNETLHVTVGDSAEMGGNMPEHEKLNITVSRRGNQIRLISRYAGSAGSPPEAQEIDVALPPGFEPYFINASAVVPAVEYLDQAEYVTTIKCKSNSTPLINFKGLMDGMYLNGLVVDEGQFKLANHMQLLGRYSSALKNSIYANTVMNDGDRIRYNIASLVSDGYFGFGLRAGDYPGAGATDQNSIWDNNSDWMRPRVLDAMMFGIKKENPPDTGKVMRMDSRWTMLYNSGPDCFKTDQQSAPINVDCVFVRLGDEYFRYLEDEDGVKFDIKRFNQLPQRPNYQVMSFATLDPTDAYNGTLVLDPTKECEVRYSRDTVSSGERAELLAMPSAVQYDESISITADYTSQFVDERGSISFKPGQSGQATVHFPMNAGQPGFFELEFDPSDRNKSYYLKFTHNQPQSDYDYVLISVHSPDGIQPHQLHVASYLNGETPTLVDDYNYGNATWSHDVSRAGIIISLVSQAIGTSYFDVMRHHPSPSEHRPTSRVYGINYNTGVGFNGDLSIDLMLTVQSHSPIDPGSWICNYNKSDFKLKKTWLGYADERPYMYYSTKSIKDLQYIKSPLVEENGNYVGTATWKITPETYVTWHGEATPEGVQPETNSNTATGLYNFEVTAGEVFDSECEAPFANHANARFYIVNNPVLVPHPAYAGFNTTGWRAGATVIRNIGNIIYLDVYDHLAQILTRTTLATITGSDQLDDYRFNWKTVETNGNNTLICRLMRDGQVLWTSPEYPVITSSNLWGKYIAAFYEVNADLDMTNGYQLPDTQYKFLTGA